MKVFTVYKHPTKGYAAVKVGFSWPAFFFSGFWMIGKGFLFLSIFYLIAIPAINIYLYDGPQTPNEWFIAFIGVLLWFYPGFYGNSWLNKKYINKGYTGAKAIPATSKEAAIALAKNEVVENSPPENINPQDSIQESSEIINERAYSVAYDEIKRYEKDDEIKWIRNLDLWAKAFAESEGDESRQKVIYVKLRAKELDLDYEYELDQERKKKANRGTLIFIAVLGLAFLIFYYSQQ